jgi:hypothetical protein
MNVQSTTYHNMKISVMTRDALGGSPARCCGREPVENLKKQGKKKQVLGLVGLFFSSRKFC